MILRPPRATPFPYTTPFRSAAAYDVSFVTAVQLRDGTKLGETLSAKIVDPGWDKMKSDARKEAATKAFQQLPGKGFHTLSKPEKQTPEPQAHSNNAARIHIE